MIKKLVSVIIPTYGRPEGLKRAIQSVMNQSYENIEVLIIDDNNPNSTERQQTEEIMKKYEHEERIRYIQHSCNKNGSVARNTGIKKSKGEFIAFLDNDDEFLERKIELQVNKIEKLGKPYGIVYTKFLRKQNNKILDKGIEDRTGNLTKEILKGNFYISAGSNIMIRREIVEEINGFNEKFLRRQDLEFLIRASL